MARALTQRQLEMLRDYADSNEPTDFDAYVRTTATPANIAWRNRERVIDALHSRALVDADGITDDGKAALGAAVEAGRIQLYKGQTL
jgi:hypothetical protein